MRPARSADHWLATAPMRVAGIAAAIPGEGEDDDQLMCGGVDDRGECSGPDPDSSADATDENGFGEKSVVRRGCFIAVQLLRGTTRGEPAGGDTAGGDTAGGESAGAAERPGGGVRAG